MSKFANLLAAAVVAAAALLSLAALAGPGEAGAGIKAACTQLCTFVIF
jgi:hypothetical protein